MKEIKIKSCNETIYTFNAPTGLPVYMWVNHDKNNVHMTLNVKYGSTGVDFTCNKSKVPVTFPYMPPDKYPRYRLKYYTDEKSVEDQLKDGDYEVL